MGVATTETLLRKRHLATFSSQQKKHYRRTCTDSILIICYAFIEPYRAKW
jgi:hypothetical protein